jgi:hypothetical protein
MQLISVYLYPNKVDAYTNYLAAWKTERYRKVYNRNLKLHRGADNRVDIQVRNSDEKPYDVSSYDDFVFNLVNRETKELILSKGCTTQNLSTGKIYVILTESELSDIEPGFYQYSIIGQIRNETDNTVISNRTPFYIDSQYGAFSNLEILNDVFGEPVDSTKVKEFRDFRLSTASPSIYMLSSIIDANPELSTPQSLHTFQFYCNNYTGKVTIQGSQSDGGNPGIWVDLDTADYIDQSTPAYKNITGKWNWFRIKYGATFNNSAQFVVGQNFSGLYSASVYDGGAGYTVGQILTITGERLGGNSGVNDLSITITSVNLVGAITGISFTGVSAPNDRSYVLGANTIPSTGSIDKVLYR